MSQAGHLEPGRQDSISAEPAGSPRSVEFGDKEQIHSTESGSAAPAFADRLLARPHPAQAPSALHRAAGAARAVLPVLQKVLPLLDGNIASVVSSLLVPAGPRVDLLPLENAVGQLRSAHAGLSARMDSQTAALQRVSDQLETLKETAERHTLEQKELAHDLIGLRRRVNLFAWVGLGLLGVSIAMNIGLFIRMGQLAH